MCYEEHEEAADFAPEKMTPEQRFVEVAGLLAAGLLRIQKRTQAPPARPSEEDEHNHFPVRLHAQEMT